MLRQDRKEVLPEDKSVSDVYENARDLYHDAREIEQQEASQALEIYFDAYDTLLDIPMEEWRDDIFRLAMSICYRGLLLAEEIYEHHPGYRATHTDWHNMRKMAKNINKIYRCQPSIEDFDYRLAAAKALLIIPHHDLMHKENASERLPDYFSETYEVAMHLLDTIDSVASVHGKHHQDLAKCYRMIGYACLELADYENGLTYYTKAIAEWSRSSKKNTAYFNFLERVYASLADHFHYDAEYRALFSFAARLYDCGESDETDVSFKELSAIYLQINSNASFVNASKLQVLNQLLEFIQERLDAGAFTMGEDGKYQARFASCSFREEMQKPYYRQRFLTMRQSLHEHQVRSQDLAGHPQKVFAERLEIASLRREVQDLRQQLMARDQQLDLPQVAAGDEMDAGDSCSSDEELPLLTENGFADIGFGFNWQASGDGFFGKRLTEEYRDELAPASPKMDL